MNTFFFTAMTKTAEGKEHSPGKEIAKILASGLLGTGVGTAIGFGAPELYEHLTGKQIPSSTLRSALPVLGALGGVAYSMHKAREQEGIRRALQDPSDDRTRRSP